jgi:hypothetical protein
MDADAAENLKQSKHSIGLGRRSSDNQGIHSHGTGAAIDDGDGMFAASQAGHFTDRLLS